MPAEWPITAPPIGERFSRVLADVDVARRMADIVRDLFLPAEGRLTEQERALMTAMLHGLIERTAVELRARLSPAVAESSTAAAAELLDDLTRAGLVQDDALAGLLLRRADIQRIASSGRRGRSTLQRWTADPDAKVAAAAMILVTARGRGRDRFGRVALDLSDLPAAVAERLVVGVGAALGGRCDRQSDGEIAGAIAALLAVRAETPALEELEAGLADALGSAKRRTDRLLVALADEGDAPLLSAVLAAEAGIPGEEAWSALLGGAERIALLLRLAAVPRSQSAAVLAAAGPALGIGDPVRAIEAFDAMDDVSVEAARAELVLPTAYRNARDMLARHG